LPSRFAHRKSCHAFAPCSPEAGISSAPPCTPPLPPAELEAGSGLGVRSEYWVYPHPAYSRVAERRAGSGSSRRLVAAPPASTRYPKGLQPPATVFHTQIPVCLNCEGRRMFSCFQARVKAEQTKTRVVGRGRERKRNFREAFCSVGCKASTTVNRNYLQAS